MHAGDGRHRAGRARADACGADRAARVRRQTARCGRPLPRPSPRKSRASPRCRHGAPPASPRRPAARSSRASRGGGGPRSDTASRPSRTSSEEPPPISNRIAPSASLIDQRRAAGRGKQRLGLAIHDIEFDADLARARSREIRAPFDAERQASVAISRERVTPRLRILSRQILQRFDRARDGRVAQPPGRRDALAQPDDARKRVDDAEAVMGRARDQQPAIIGAEIERGIGRTIEIRSHSGAICARMYGRTATPRVGGTQIVGTGP